MQRYMLPDNWRKTLRGRTPSSWNLKDFHMLACLKDRHWLIWNSFIVIRIINAGTWQGLRIPFSCSPLPHQDMAETVLGIIGVSAPLATLTTKIWDRIKTVNGLLAYAESPESEKFEVRNSSGERNLHGYSQDGIAEKLRQEAIVSIGQGQPQRIREDVVQYRRGASKIPQCFPRRPHQNLVQSRTYP
jgi:hypothetical protein